MSKRRNCERTAWRRYIVLSLLVFYWVTPSQEPPSIPQNFHRWGSISVFNGLPSDGVHSITQTPDGFLWFGTDNGLARYDGSRIQNYSLGEGDSNHILLLKVSPTGELWAGTLSGAYRSTGGDFELIAGTQGIGIPAMQFDGNQFLLGSDTGALYRVIAENDLLQAERLTDDLTGTDKKAIKITGLATVRGQLFAATYGGGLCKINDGRLTEFRTTPRPLLINSISADPAGVLWIGVDAVKGTSGVYRMVDGPDIEEIKASTASVLSVFAEDSGVWAGSARYGVYRFGGPGIEIFTFENTSTGLRSNTIYSIFVDRESVIWIGTNRGVSRYDRLAPSQQTVSDIPNSNFIRTFFQGDGRELLAGSNRGLFRAEKDQWTEVAGFENKPIYSIAAGANGIIAGTPTGVFDSSGKMIIPGDTRSIRTFKGNLYAAVQGRGLVNISDGSQPTVFPVDDVSSLLVAVDRLWIGTSQHGLFSFDGQNVRPEADPNVLKSGTIWNMFQAADHSIWIAGQHGVSVVRNGVVEQIFTAEEVRDVYFADGQVWAATTTRGLLHARKDELLGWIVSHVGFEQGFPSDKAFAILPQNDQFLIATNRGVVTYKPGTVPPKLVPIRILSQRFHDLKELRSPISLDYPQNSILVEVAGLSSRTFAEEFQYSFQLKDGNGKVLDSRFSSASQYTPSKLSPGDYQIVSQAFDRDLLASEPLTIRFCIAKAPFPWTATALGILLVLSLFGLAWAIIEHRRMKERNTELATARLDLANEAERERRRIARDLHDQTLADLRNLLMMSDNMAVDEPDFRTEIENVSSEIRRICEDLSPSVLENVGFTASLEFLLSRSIDNHKFVADDDLDESVSFPIGVQLQIYRIAQEVLTNIRKHSNADVVEMTVKVRDDGRFVLHINDNGKVFDPAGNNKGRGINNIKARASLINARVLWKEGRRGGNRFSLTIDG